MSEFIRVGKHIINLDKIITVAPDDEDEDMIYLITKMKRVGNVQKSVGFTFRGEEAKALKQFFFEKTLVIFPES